MKAIVRIFLLTLVITACAPFNARAQNLNPAQKTELERQLTQVEAEQKQAEADLSQAQSQSASLSRDINVLNAKIKTAQLNIKAKNLLIQTLGNDIVAKQNHIDDLEGHIAKGKETLAQILRKTNELDQYSLPEVVLSQSTVGGFFHDIDAFNSVEQGLRSTFEQLRSDEASTIAEKNSLDARRNAEMDARYAIQQEQKNIQKDENDKQQLLSVSKDNEKAYSSLVASKRAKAAEIRAQLFALRDTAAIPFGQALQYATLASQKTGVRPAFLLAILTQESNLGKNVGSCYLSNVSNGDGVNVQNGSPISKVMNPNRDVPPFLDIMRSVGGDPMKTAVSCPQTIGWGGAMGPAQFIASTWAVIEDRLASYLGISGVPNPWNPGHAFMAAAMYLSDRGAVAGSYSSEKNAACKYYSGSSCGKNGNTYYGNSVMALADSIQRNMIDPLSEL